MEKIVVETLDPGFKDEVAACTGGENIKLCFACGACTAVCPVALLNDSFNPRRIIRQVLLGQRREVLSSPELWQCLQCYACYAKCPQNVKFRDVIGALRALAVQGGHVQAETTRERARLDDLMCRLLREAVTLLLSARPKYEQLKNRLETLLPAPPENGQGDHVAKS